jgi:DNA-binding transcriptional ArsR family regulator
MSLQSSELFKVLGVETRVKIIDLLKTEGPLGSKYIAETLGITTAAVSQHLKLLKQAGLVKNERKGYWIPYSIDVEALQRCGELLNQVCTCGCGGTGTFRQKELCRADIEFLKKYEKELLDELRSVRERIKEMNGKK